MKMSNFKNPHALAVLVQIIFAGVILLSKGAYNQGINIYIFVFYRQAFGAFFMIPPAIYFERKSCPPLNLPNLSKIFGIALVGITMSLVLIAIGLKSTSSTFVASTLNCIPVTTILIAVVLRMETIDVRKRVGLAKVAGIMLCLAAVAIRAFYKGPHFNPPLSLHLIKNDHNPSSSGTTSWLEGALFSVIGILLWSLGLVFLGMLLRTFTSKLILSSIICLSSAIQSLLMAVIMERNPSEWRLTWNLTLVAILYCGAIGSGVLCYIQALVIEMKGAVFLALYSPISLLIAMLLSFMLLDEPIHIAGIIGGVLSICSLYSVLWAKNIEEENKVAVVIADIEIPPTNDLTEQREEAHVALGVSNKSVKTGPSPGPIQDRTDKDRSI